jgi:hypothetical protein
MEALLGKLEAGEQGKLKAIEIKLLEGCKGKFRDWVNKLWHASHNVLARTEPEIAANTRCA